MTTNQIKTLIAEAAAIGQLTVDQLDGGEDFEDVAEWIEYASEQEIEDAAIYAGLISDRGGDIYEISRAGARTRAKNAGIKGA